MSELFAAFLCVFVVCVCVLCTPVVAWSSSGHLAHPAGRGKQRCQSSSAAVPEEWGKREFYCAVSEEQSSLKWYDRRQEQAFESPEVTECFVTARWLDKSHCSVEDVRAVCILLLG